MSRRKKRTSETENTGGKMSSCLEERKGRQKLRRTQGGKMSLCRTCVFVRYIYIKKQRT
jgi:hypothetical protein